MAGFNLKKEGRCFTSLLLASELPFLFVSVLWHQDNDRILPLTQL